MYHALLANRYLTSRFIPFVAVAAVALCVALVITVVSVMTGFLDMVRDSGRTLMGDVIVSSGLSGIPYSERLIDRLEALPEVEAATPVVDGWGLLKMPYPHGDRKDVAKVQFWAIDPESFARVTGYADTLYWRDWSQDEVDEMWEGDFRLRLREELGSEALASIERAGLELRRRDQYGVVVPAIALGQHVSEGNKRTSEGTIDPWGFMWWMPQFSDLVLTTMPTDSLASPEPKSVSLVVANEFQSGVYLIDDTRVFIPIDVGQRLLNLDGAQIVDDEDELTGFDMPPRATMVLLRAADGTDADELRDLTKQTYEAFYSELLVDDTVHPRARPPVLGVNGVGGVRVHTWREQQASFIDPVEKERELMRTIFSLIYLVCAGLVLAIFWAIVYEKTRDIGILRSVGASRLGIALIFVRYGLVIGVLGALVGVGLAFLVTNNINTIHDVLGSPPLWLAIFFGVLGVATGVATYFRSRSGRLLPLTLGSLSFLVFAGLSTLTFLGWKYGGAIIWDPAVYYFTEIPDTLDPVAAVTTMLGAILFSVIGAFFPAARAADIDPIKALRYE